MNFQLREATINDIQRIQEIRRMVKENILSDPKLVSDKDCISYITQRGKGWVAYSNSLILGFAIADLKADNIWALFLHPDYQNRGIGKSLHDTMLEWYFQQGKEQVWLSTEPATRAEGFYRKQGWQERERLPNGEIKFEMTQSLWLAKNGKEVITP